MQGLPPRPPFSGSAGPSRSSGTPRSHAGASGTSGNVAPNYTGGYAGHQSINAPAFNPAFSYPSPQYPATGYQQYPVSYPYPAYNPWPYQTSGQSLFNPPPPPPLPSASQPIHWQSQQTAPMYHPSEPPSKRIRHDQPTPAPIYDLKAWRNCSHPGCKFVGSGDKVEEHEGDRHLIFRNGPKVELSEEEMRYAKHKGPPPPVFGTSITLHTQEEIDKWLAERRAKWPSAKRIEAKAEERQQAIARGENPDKKQSRRALDPAAQAEDWGRSDEARNPRGSERGGHRDRGRGRGDHGVRGVGRGGGRGRGISDPDRGGRGRGRGRGRGGGSGDGIYGQVRDNGYSQLSSDDLQPNTNGHAPASALPGSHQSEPANVNAAALAGLDYPSSTSSSSLSSSDDSSDSSSDTSSDTSSDSEEENIVKPESAETLRSAMVDQRERKEQPIKPVCRYWVNNGRCRFGDKCHMAHPPRADFKDLPERTAPARKQIPQPPQPKINPFARPSLLGQLLAVPIQNTLSQLTQTIRFLVANDMLDHVELRPGQAEDAVKKASMVTVVDGEATVQSGDA